MRNFTWKRFPIKICWSIPYLHPSWKVHTMILVCVFHNICVMFRGLVKWERVGTAFLFMFCFEMSWKKCQNGYFLMRSHTFFVCTTSLVRLFPCFLFLTLSKRSNLAARTFTINLSCGHLRQPYKMHWCIELLFGSKRLNMIFLNNTNTETDVHYCQWPLKQRWFFKHAAVDSKHCSKWGKTKISCYSTNTAMWLSQKTLCRWCSAIFKLWIVKLLSPDIYCMWTVKTKSKNSHMTWFVWCRKRETKTFQDQHHLWDVGCI